MKYIWGKFVFIFYCIILFLIVSSSMYIVWVYVFSNLYNENVYRLIKGTNEFSVSIGVMLSFWQLIKPSLKKLLV